MPLKNILKSIKQKQKTNIMNSQINQKINQTLQNPAIKKHTTSPFFYIFIFMVGFGIYLSNKPALPTPAKANTPTLEQEAKENKRQTKITEIEFTLNKGQEQVLELKKKIEEKKQEMEVQKSLKACYVENKDDFETKCTTK